MQAPSLVLRRLQSNTMQHPLTGATCVALPNVGMCPQLSCALTFMYLQQVSLLNFFFSYIACFVSIVWGFVILEVFCVWIDCINVSHCVEWMLCLHWRMARVSRKYVLTENQAFAFFGCCCTVFIDAVGRYLTQYFDCFSRGCCSRVSAVKDCSLFTCRHKLYF